MMKMVVSALIIRYDSDDDDYDFHIDHMDI